MRFELTSQETKLLRDILDTQLDGLYREIARTDTREFRNQLKDRAAQLEALVARIWSAAQGAAYA